MLTTILLFSKLHLREGERAAEQGSTEQSRQTTDSPTAAKRLHWSSHPGLRGDAAREIASDEDAAEVRRSRKIETSKRLRDRDSYAKGIRRRKVQGQSPRVETEHHRSCPNHYPRPGGDLAQNFRQSQRWVCNGSLKSEAGKMLYKRKILELNGCGCADHKNPQMC